MKHWKVLLLSSFISLSAFAADEKSIALNFQQIPVTAFSEAMYKGVLGRDFVLTPEAAALDKRITISVKSISKDKLPALLESVLSQVGLQVKSRGGIDYIEAMPVATVSPLQPQPKNSAETTAPTAAEAKEKSGTPTDVVEIYHPRFRSADYLYSVLRVLGMSKSTGLEQGKGATDLVILVGTSDRIERAKKLLSEIDARPLSVAVRAAVIEFTETGDSGFSIGAVASLLAGKLSATLNPGATLGNFIRIKTGGIDAALSAINGDSRFRLVSEPNIRIVDGEKGRIVVGSDQPVRGAVTYDKSGAPIQSIDYRTSGVLLTVEPRIYQERISAHVFHQVSNFGETKTSGIDSPTLLKRELETQVDLDDGELLLLGGLDENKATQSRSGLSFLPSFFHATSDVVSRTRLVVMLEMRKI